MLRLLPACAHDPTRPYNAAVLPDEYRRPLTDLVFLRRAPLAVRITAVVVCAVAAGIAGTELARLQEHFAALLVSGAPLSSFQSLLAHGSTAATAAAAWLAAVLFSVALLRLRREPLEPPAGTKPVEAQTPAQLRSGLRREYRLIRVALIVVLLVAATDVSRAMTLTAVIAGRNSVLSDSFAATLVEASGLAIAAAVLAWWAKNFAPRLEQLGVL
jgi:hypothetical protein